MNAINIKFPIEDDVEKNRFLLNNTVTKDALSSNLMLLLLTDKGERYYYPDYGTNLRKYIFEPNDIITQNDVESDIKNTVKNYIPELNIDNVRFYTSQYDDDGDYVGEAEIRVVINFSYNENVFSDSGTLELSFKK